MTVVLSYETAEILKKSSILKFLPDIKNLTEM